MRDRALSAEEREVVVVIPGMLAKVERGASEDRRERCTDIESFPDNKS